jgi:hypothetical protein
LVRTAGAVVAVAAQHERAVACDLACELVEQPRLARTRFAGDEDDPCRTPPDCGPRAAQPRQLGRATDERPAGDDLA